MNKFSIIRLFRKILFKFPISNKLKTKWYIWYHSLIFSSLKPYFNKAFKLTKYKHISSTKKYNSGIIWMFWWQGYNNAPLIVQKCIQSVKRHASGHRVILLDKDNVKKYAKLPKYIYKKFDNCKISIIHFSDALRVNLLHNYGGLWIDSTMYCSSNLDHKYFNYIYTSGGYPNLYHQFVSSKWTSFLLGSNKDSRIFAFIDTFFQLYWKNNNYAIDYFLLDYSLYYAYIHNISNFKMYCDNVAYKNNPHLYYLVNILNRKYNKNEYQKISSDTNLFKLTYKQPFSDKIGTYYYRLLNNQL